MKKEIIFFDDTDSFDREDEIREYLFDWYGEENGWTKKEDIPDERVWNELAFQERLEYEDFTEELDKILRTGVYLLQGTCGRWNGDFPAGEFIRGYSDLRRGLEHLDYIKFYEVNGHFYIYGCHHDGSDKYELKQLTDRGIALAERNWYAHDRELHNKIMQSSTYSKLPRINAAIYGGSG